MTDENLGLMFLRSHRALNWASSYEEIIGRFCLPHRGNSKAKVGV